MRGDHMSELIKQGLFSAVLVVMFVFTLTKQPSASIPTGFPNFVSVDFATFGVHVAVGEQLALVLRGAIRRVDDSALNWRGDKGDPYAFGSAFVRTNVDPWTQLCGFGTCNIPG